MPFASGVVERNCQSTLNHQEDKAVTEGKVLCRCVPRTNPALHPTNNQEIGENQKSRGPRKPAMLPTGPKPMPIICCPALLIKEETAHWEKKNIKSVCIQRRDKNVHFCHLLVEDCPND